jgi:hypothetical protein
MNATTLRPTHRTELESNEIEPEMTVKYHTKTSMNIYKCRAECSGDIARVMKELKKVIWGKMKTIKMEKTFGGTAVWTFSTYEEINWLRKFITDLNADLHVIVQTLELEADYTGDRNWKY